MMYIKTPDKASFEAILYDFHFVTKEIQHFFSILSQKNFLYKYKIHILVIILLFSPEFCQKILQIPVIGSFSQLFLSSYLFYGNYWIWQKQVMVILILIGILLFAIQAVMDMTEKRDYFL